jgi:hypothetical protein
MGFRFSAVIVRRRNKLESFDLNYAANGEGINFLKYDKISVLNKKLSFAQKNLNFTLN